MFVVIIISIILKINGSPYEYVRTTLYSCPLFESGKLTQGTKHFIDPVFINNVAGEKQKFITRVGLFQDNFSGRFIS